jgi:hypothetical protein
MIVEKQLECKLAGKTEVLGEKPASAPLLSITKSRAAAAGETSCIDSYNLAVHNG